MNLQSKKILITGGNGFLGSALVKFFINKGYEVFVISKHDNNLTDVMDKIGFFTLNTDDYYEAKDYILNLSPDCVIHAAWDGGNSHTNVNDMSQFSKNFSLTFSMLDILSQLDKKPVFMGVGSFAEYGNLTKQATEEDIESPTNFYGLSKLMVNRMSKMFCEKNGMKWAWIRPCYVYGPNDVATRIIPTIVNSLLQDKQISLDSCNVTVDYLHINDFCEAIHTIIAQNLEGVYNICSGKEYSLRAIIELLYKLTLSHELEPTFGAQRKRVDSPSYVCGSNNKLKSFGWASKYELYDGIVDTINYYRNNRSVINV